MNMIQLYWKGIAVPDNERHTLHYRKPKGSHGAAAIPVIGASSVYEGFRDGMATMFRGQAHGQTYYRPNARIMISIYDDPKEDKKKKSKDKANLLKAILDAIEIAGIVKNDREFNHSWVTLPPITPHPKGEDDEIFVTLTERKEETP
jgi:Holliday junction resolvase RusA-like endonuclease